MNPGVPDVIAAQPISHVYVWLGGPQPKNGRGPAFFRDGDNQTAIDLNDEKNCWFDHRDQVGGGVLDLVQHVRGCNRTEAVEWLSGHNGVELNHKADPAKPPRSAAAHREYMQQQGWRPVCEGYFTDTLRSVRFEHATRIQPTKNKPDKTYAWEHRVGEEWLSGAGGPLPVYFNSTCKNRAQPEELILVEGWMKADALAMLDIPAGSLKEIKPGNAMQFERFRRIVIWPDKDAAGLRDAAKVGDLLRKHNTNVHVMEPPGELPETGDAIDAIAMGWTGERIRAVIATAGKDARKIQRVEDVPPIETFESVGIEWDIDGIIARGAFTLLTGESGAGKTTWITAAGYAIAHGYSFMGRATSKRPVLILDAENGLSSVVERCQRMGIATSDDFRIWGQWVGEDPPAPGSAVLYDWVTRCTVKPVLIVDNLIAFCPSAENNSEDMRRYLAPCRKLASMGCSVVLLHHTGKGETSRDYRGSSDIKASVDIAYRLINLGDGTKLSIMELKPFKQRFTVTPQLTIRYDDGVFSVDNQGTIARTVTERLVDLLKFNPGISVAEFQKLANDQQLGRNRARLFLDSPGVECKTGDKNRHFYSWKGGE